MELLLRLSQCHREKRGVIPEDRYIYIPSQILHMLVDSFKDKINPL